MSNCTSSCKTQDHQSYGECLKQNSPMFAGCFPTRQGWDKDKENKDNKELNSYWSALKQGVEPVSTQQKDIDAAMKISNDVGKAFDGNTMGFRD
jgi:hypothetical protein